MATRGNGKVYRRNIASLDGLITEVADGDFGTTQTRFTYFDLARDGYNLFSLQWRILATTLTIEACNMNSDTLTTVSDTADGTDGTGATLVCSILNGTYGYEADDDLIGCVVTITADATTPGNVGLSRVITDYAEASGTLTFATAFGATTTGVTAFTISDGTGLWDARVDDPTQTLWTDITNALTGAANQTVTGAHIQDTPLEFERVRVRRVSSAANNSLDLALTRGGA